MLMCDLGIYQIDSGPTTTTSLLHTSNEQRFSTAGSVEKIGHHQPELDIDVTDNNHTTHRNACTKKIREGPHKHATPLMSCYSPKDTLSVVLRRLIKTVHSFYAIIQ